MWTVFNYLLNIFTLVGGWKWKRHHCTSRWCKMTPLLTLFLMPVWTNLLFLLAMYMVLYQSFHLLKINLLLTSITIPSLLINGCSLTWQHNIYSIIFFIPALLILTLTELFKPMIFFFMAAVYDISFPLNKQRSIKFVCVAECSNNQSACSFLFDVFALFFSYIFFSL